MRPSFLFLATLAVFALARPAEAQLGGGRYPGDAPRFGSHATARNAPTHGPSYYIPDYRFSADPQAAVRRKAEYRAMQRQQRIAFKKATGRSTHRPNVYNTLFGSYLPRTYPFSLSYEAPVWISQAPRGPAYR